MARTMILPAAARYLSELATAGASGASRGVATVCDRVGGLIDRLVTATDALEHAQHEAHEAGSVQDEARSFSEVVIPAQAVLREVADELETVVSDELWPLPKYRELLFAY
jgi:glutamine synthetase